MHQASKNYKIKTQIFNSNKKSNLRSHENMSCLCRKRAKMNVNSKFKEKTSQKQLVSKSLKGIANKCNRKIDKTYAVLEGQRELLFSRLR